MKYLNIEHKGMMYSIVEKMVNLLILFIRGHGILQIKILNHNLSLKI